VPILQAESRRKPHSSPLLSSKSTVAHRLRLDIYRPSHIILTSQRLWRIRVATVLIGYDVELMSDWVKEISRTPVTTSMFIEKARNMHEDLGIPCTLFVSGVTLEKNAGPLRDLVGHPLFAFGQHTYSHILLKTVVIDDGVKKELIRAAAPEDIRVEIGKTQDVMKQILGLDCRGLTGPYGYYRGLQDRPDILEIIDSFGIRFLRTDARDQHDYQPVPFEHQPYWYSLQGFPDILEFPIQGWQDYYVRVRRGWDDVEGFIEDVTKEIDVFADTDLIIGYAQHDWTSLVNDPEMEATRRIYEYALTKGVSFEKYEDVYERLLAQKK